MSRFRNEFCRIIQFVSGDRQPKNGHFAEKPEALVLDLLQCHLSAINSMRTGSGFEICPVR